MAKNTLNHSRRQISPRQNQTIPGQRRCSEPLEPRLLLSGFSSFVPIGMFTTEDYRSGALNPFQISASTVQAGGTISVTYSCGDAPLIACSDALLTNVMVDGAVTPATEGGVGLYDYDPPAPLPDAGAVVQAPAGSHTVTFEINPTAPTEGITANGDGGAVSYYSGPWITGSVGGGYYSSAQPFQIQGTNGQLAFIQNPSDTVVGDKIEPPVTVAVQDYTGAQVGGSTDSVTLSIASGDGTLAGTTTEPAVNGIATFSNLSIDDEGSYTLTATDNTTASTTSATSSSFDINGGKLVFHVAPKSGIAGEAIAPSVIVYLETAKNKLLTTDSSTVVTLNLVGFTSANPISGNTATVSGGIATFSNIVLTQPGTYQLQASDTNGDVVATTKKFAVSGDKLVFIADPHNGDVNTPLTMKIEAQSHGKRDTKLTDSVQLGLNVISGKTTALLAGTTTLPLVNGLATFVASDAVEIDLPGIYTLTATAANSDGTDYTVGSATSAKFRMNPVTLRDITAVLGTTKKISTDDGLDITDANAFAVLQSSGTITLTAAGLTPATPAVLDKIGWTIQRNDADAVTGAAPALTVAAGNPLQSTVALNGEGSFNVICYYDANSNGMYDAGEELKVFHLAEVAVVINPSAGSVVTDSSHFASRPYNAYSTIIQEGSFNGPFAITMSESVEVVGGGTNGMIGVDKVHLGFVQDGTSNNFTVQYQNGRTAREVLDKGTFPILDASYNPDPHAPYAIFTLPSADLGHPDPHPPGPVRDPVTNPSDPNGGEDRTIETADAPTVEFQNTYAGSPASSASGSENFIAYLAAYSDDVTGSYIGYVSVNWSETFQYQHLLNNWINTGSNVTSSVATLATPTPLESLGVKVTGPIYPNDVVTR